MTTPVILKLDAGGLPVGWIHWQTAVTLYARERVCWEAGEERFAITGGINARTGERSQFEIGSIIAVADKSKRYTQAVPLLTNRTLFQRDHNLCLYCGDQFNPAQLTRDHIMPASRGGETTWENCVTACRDCNQEKDARTPEESGMKLIAQNPAHGITLRRKISWRRRLTSMRHSQIPNWGRRYSRPSFRASSSSAQASIGVAA